MINHIHHLALLVSIVVFLTILLNIFIPQDSHNHFEKNSAPENLWRVDHEMKWISKSGTKGVLRPSIFIAMIITFMGIVNRDLEKKEKLA